jgi:4-amino-4-deoxy-L-arabinose transferase-like glycosyltransferase
MPDLPSTNPAFARPPGVMNILLFTLLFCAFIFPGVLGRDPWKADEAYTVGLVLNLHETGDWVVPRLGADPFLEKPPIFFLTAAAFGRVFSSVLEFHEAARLASVFYLALSLLFVALASRELFGAGTGWVAALLLLGCLGNVHFAHMLVTDNALLTGFALAIYGLTLGLRRPWLAGCLTGTGAGLAFLAKGLLGPGIIGVMVAVLPLVGKTWRTKSYPQMLGGILLSITPWLLIWPLLLYHDSPKLFLTWFWNNNVERFLGRGLGKSDRSPIGYLVQMPLVALPVLPFAAWNLWRHGRAGLRDPRLQLPLCCFLATYAVLSLAGQRRSNYLPPAFVPLALLAVGAAINLPRRAVLVLNRFIFILATSAAVLCWFVWIAHLAGFPPALLNFIHRQVPKYEPSFHGNLFLVALAFSLGWGALVMFHRRESSFVAAHWAASVALLYLLGMTLWLPLTNLNNTYRYDFAGLREALGNSQQVVLGRNVGEPQRAMIHYFAGIKVTNHEEQAPPNNRWLLVEGRSAAGKQPQSPGSNWSLVWQGQHQRELFRLYRRDS